MQGKFVFGGEGMKVPGTDFGLSISLFKIWLCPVGQAFKGYTTASNQGLRGWAIIESPVVDFDLNDLESELPFMNLHGTSVDVTLSAATFVKDGGTATLRLALRSNDGGSRGELSFFSEACKGFSAAIGVIHFEATLLELPADESDAAEQSFVPW
jgi:hypothetical protein